MPKRHQHDNIVELQLDHDPANTLSPEVVEELSNQLDQAFQEAEGIILSGREGLFSAGLNLAALLQLDEAGMTRFWQSFFGLLGKLAGAPIPVVAALTGHSPAGGAVCAICCDYRVMTAGDYRIGLNEVQVGLVAPVPIQNALVRLVGARQAERLLVAGALITPQQALEVGLVDELADSPRDTVTAARNWLDQHLKLPRQAMLETRRIVRRPVWEPFQDLEQLGIQDFATHWFRDDTQQHLRQVLEQLASRRT